MKFLFLISFLIISRICFGAIAHDDTSTGQMDAQVTLTIEHTVAAGSNLMLIVHGIGEDNASAAGAEVTGVTWNTVAMTKAVEVKFRAGDVNQASQWYLDNPNTGTHDAVLTFGDDGPQGGIGAVMSLSGVAQQAPESTNTNSDNTGTNDTPTVDITTSTNNAWIIDGVNSAGSGTTHTAGSGQTERFDVQNAGNVAAAGSTEPVAVAGLTTMDWTQNAATQWGILAADYAPAAVAAVRRQGIWRNSLGIGF